MLNLVCVGVGGAAGALLRFGMTGMMNRFWPGPFPAGTLSVNLIGSLALGILAGMSEMTAFPEPVRLLLIVGVLGGFTTFSAFSAENFDLLRSGAYGLFAINVLASVFLGLILTFVGYWAVHRLSGS